MGFQRIVIPDQLPEFRANLIPALSYLEVNDLTHISLIRLLKMDERRSAILVAVKEQVVSAFLQGLTFAYSFS